MIDMQFFMIFILGACVGSFLNVCIYRIPEGKSVVFPRSSCKCGKAIPFWNNIPLISWIVLGGKAKCCGGKIPARYFIVELLTALMFLVLFCYAGSLEEFAVSCSFCSLLVVVAFIDIDTMEIHDILSVGGMVAGLLVSFLFPNWCCERMPLDALNSSVLGVFFGSGLMFWIAVFGEIAFKKEAIGVGDIKLMGTIGAFIGWKGVLFSIFGGCFLGSIIALPLFLCLKIFRRKILNTSHEIPFAPFLVIGAISYVLFGDRIVDLLYRTI